MSYLQLFYSLFYVFIHQIACMSYSGWNPPNCYGLNAKVGDLMSATCTWLNGANDVDLSLFLPSTSINYSNYRKCDCKTTGTSETTTHTVQNTVGMWIYCVNLNSGTFDFYSLNIYLNGVLMQSASSILLARNSQYFKVNIPTIPCMIFLQLTSTHSFKASLYAPGTVLVSPAVGVLSYTANSGAVDTVFAATVAGIYDLEVMGDPEKPPGGTWTFVQYNGNVNCDTCIAHMTQCLTCTSSKVCTTCNSGFYVDSVNHLCNACSTITNCLFCTSSTVCTECDSTHKVAANNLCELCNVGLTNCATCTDSPITKCLSCNSGYFLDSTTFVCNPCNTLTADCTKCTSSTVCIACITSQYVKSPILCELCNVVLVGCTNCSQDGLKCFNCVNNSYILSGDACLTCNNLISACLTCSSTTTCLTCSVGYFIAPGTATGDAICQSCQTSMPGCNTCSSAAFCLTLNNDTYTIYADGSVHLCNVLLNNCQKCSGSSNCLSCMAGYFIFNGQCKVCNQIIKFCYLCHVSTFCDVCEPGFVPSSSGNCTCQHGKYVPSTCTNVSGCIFAQKILNKSVCLQCVSSQNFVYNPVTKFCDCALGYIHYNNTCVQYCGDGTHFIQECDDGNLNNGDGCDWKCKVQYEYACIGNKYEVSKCLLNIDVKIQYLYIVRTDGENKAKAYFSITPDNAKLSQLNFTKCISSANIQVSKLSALYFSDRIEVDFDYSGPLQQLVIEISFDLSSSIYLSLPSHHQVSISAIYPPLTIVSQASLFKNVLLIGKLLSYLTLIVFAVSLIFHQMIGLELILVMQIIYAIGVMATNNTQSYRVYTSMASVMHINQIIQGSRINIISPQTIRYFVDNQSFIYALNISFGLFVAAGIGFIVFKILLAKDNHKLRSSTLACLQLQKKSVKISKSRKQQLKQQMQEQKFVMRDFIFHTNHKKQLLYQRVIYPLGISLLNPLILLFTISLIGSNTGQSPMIQNLSYYLLLVMMIALMILVVSQIRKMTANHKQSQLKLPFRSLVQSIRIDKIFKYQTIFLIHNIVTFVLILIGFQVGSPRYSTISIIIVTFLYLIILKCLNPYKNRLHTNIIIIIYSLIILQSIFILLDSYQVMTQKMSLILILLVFILSYVSVILTIYRLFRDHCQNTTRYSDVTESNVKKQQHKNKVKITDGLKFNKFVQKTNLRCQISGFIDYNTSIKKQKSLQQKYQTKQQKNEYQQLLYLKSKLRQQMNYIKDDNLYYGDQKIKR